LAVFAATAIDAARLGFLFFQSGLAFDAKPDPRNRVAAGLRNRAATLLAFRGALAPRQLATGSLNLILNACVDLILNRTIT
jgi:hypothetical protein